MWKLKIAEGGDAWLRTTNEHVGRQIWEFDPKAGSPEELAEIETVRQHFWDHRFEKKHSSDLLMRIQVSNILSLRNDVYRKLLTILKSIYLFELFARYLVRANCN